MSPDEYCIKALASRVLLEINTNVTQQALLLNKSLFCLYKI
ncbi:hypothetical protein PSPO_a1891 [Pseudoalteromonas spongiae UST010723-006]|nr:hypothetical protein PSPO_a1891 [Pseudoalteromonas spongiae UST010723-006]